MSGLRAVLDKEGVSTVKALLNKRGQQPPASLRQILSRVRLNFLVTEMKANKTTESNFLNDHDEVYLVLAGGSSRKAFSNQRIYRSREGGNDYTSFGLNQGLDEVLPLKSSEIENGIDIEAGEFVGFTVGILEQDNAQLESILGILKGAAFIAGGALVGWIIPTGAFATKVGEELTEGAKSEWKGAVSSFFNSLSTSGDQLIGGFSVFVLNDKGKLKFTWKAEKETALVSPSDQSSALFSATGSQSSYTVRVGCQQN